jgi:hypothetical protein
MQSGDGPSAIPQFETAEFPAKPGTDSCFACHQPISGSYFRVNAQMACGACAERLKNSIPKDSHAAFARAVTFGAGAAVAGLALYAVVGIVTGLMIGYVSLAVGWMVAKAMMKGSGELGGRRYQIVAVLFTYAAVSLAAIPMAIADLAKTKKPRTENRALTQQPNENANQAPADDDQKTPSSQAKGEAAGRHLTFLSTIGYLALVGLASPFLELGSDPLNGLIGLVILLVGIRIAWQMTRGHPPLVVDGPF